MSAFDLDLLTAKAASIERHLRRVETTLAKQQGDLNPGSDASDAIVLHLWQAVQLTMDLAFAASSHLNLPAAATYGDAFRNCAREGTIDGLLAQRLVQSTGFRNAIAHAYEELDRDLVLKTASSGPADLRRFLAAMAALA